MTDHSTQLFILSLVLVILWESVLLQLLLSLYISLYSVVVVVISGHLHVLHQNMEEILLHTGQPLEAAIGL